MGSVQVSESQGFYLSDRAAEEKNGLNCRAFNWFHNKSPNSSADLTFFI